MKKFKDIEPTLFAILSGVLMNGYLHGQEQAKIDTNVVELALLEIKKLLS